MLRMQYAKEQALQRRLQREREAEIRRGIDEREMLLKNITLLRERNRKATSPWQPEILKDLGDLRREEQLLKDYPPEPYVPVIRQVRNYEPIQAENAKERNVNPQVNVNDKGKEKMVGIRINEPPKVVQGQNVMSQSDIELEKKRKEREAIAKRLEIAENEAAIAEMNNKIRFLESSKMQSGNATNNVTHSGNVVNPNNANSSSSTGPSSSDLKINQTQLNCNTTTSNIPNNSHTQNTWVGPQRRPIQLEGYR
jgi:hypothetical protein